MGNCGSADDGSKFQLRVLSLGTAASGKSTFARQMVQFCVPEADKSEDSLLPAFCLPQKIIFCDGFNEQELSNYKSILQHNLCLGLKELVQRLDEAGIEINKKVKKVRCLCAPFSSRCPAFACFSLSLICTRPPITFWRQMRIRRSSRMMWWTRYAEIVSANVFSNRCR